MKKAGERPALRGTEVAKQHPQLTGVLTLVKDLAAVSHSDSTAELFGQSFHTLAKAVPFDVGVAVMLEQNLDLYISSRAAAARHVGQPLVDRVRGVLKSVIPVSFTAAEMLVKDERQTLDDDGRPAGLEHDVHAILRQEDRTAGLLLMARGGSPFSDDEQNVMEIFTAQLSMLLENLRAREKIISLAETDELTGVHNRRYFRRQLSYEMERARVYNVPLALLLIDVDDFKEVNDSFGHVMGDIVLSELCGTVKSTLRTPDSISRFGGDEFAVILPHTDMTGAGAVAERVLRRVEETTLTSEDGRPIRCTVSVGIAQCDPADGTFSDLVRRADDRLYEAKRLGKNRYVY
ncbi:MAG TPA: sensor domain-containing diguanylate cyclase [Thermoanaerobaculia bacterium]|nr:sensor domain-containing diguanylate cyclase [Thermoanaerobaculia bacterium]